MPQGREYKETETRVILYSKWLSKSFKISDHCTAHSTWLITCSLLCRDIVVLTLHEWSQMRLDPSPASMPEPQILPSHENKYEICSSCDGQKQLAVRAVIAWLFCTEPRKMKNKRKMWRKDWLWGRNQRLFCNKRTKSCIAKKHLFNKTWLVLKWQLHSTSHHPGAF